MRRLVRAAIFGGVLMSCGTPKAPTPSTPQAIASAYIDDLVQGRKKDPRWSELEAAAGRFFEVKSAVPEPGGVRLTCVFEHTEKVLDVQLDDRSAVTGLTWTASPELLESRTRAMVQSLNDGDFLGAEKHYGTVMRQAMPPDKLSAAWKELEARAGRFQTIEAVKLESPAPRKFGTIATASFERAKLLVKVFYDEHDEVIGLFFAPANPWSPPSYAHPDAVVESDVTVGSDPALPGTLAMPKEGGSVPAIVLVHGSGPGDRDEAIGGVRVFEDLALGLAARGIAVLRYDKRTRVSPKGVVTEKEEVLDGATAAIALLAQTPRVDAKRIFVLGHSQGGNLAPRIAAAAPEIAGYVVMAGNTRPLEDLVVDQYEYFATLHPDNDGLKKKVEEAREFKRQVESPSLKPDDKPEAPFGGGVTGAYFLYQRGYDPVATAKSLALPVLVLQGGRDYQVTEKDFDRWTSGLAGTAFATLKQYPADNHLFVPGSGPPNPEEYEKPGHVDPHVVTDIADWVMGTKPR